MRRLAATALIAWLTVACAPTPSARAMCTTPEGTAALFVTEDCVDPTYSRPVVDGERDLSTPVEHRRVDGHFEGTDVRFSVYLPPSRGWQGRFFQSVYPLDGVDVAERSLRFASASGGYAVQTNASGGYRADAAAAMFSREVAHRYYGSSHRIHGYLYGGSGGSYQTIAAMENSSGVWDGAVPFIVGDPSSIPNNFFIRALGRLVLRDHAAAIADAVAPGGSGDPFAGLDAASRQVLAEITHLGLPVKAWEDPDYVLGLDAEDGLLGFTAQVKQMDPTYADDFWRAPGYLGSQQSALGERIRAARVNGEVTVTGVRRGAAASETVVSVDGDHGSAFDGMIDVRADGVPMSTGTLDGDSGTVTVSGDAAVTLRDALRPGARLHVDNSWYVAATAYPRHQVPVRRDFDAYDQYRLSDGTPRYPQRPLLVGTAISEMVSEGGEHTGKLHGKVIAVSNLLDADAFPWHGDWYSRQVRAALGEDYGNDFRLWLVEGADHIAPPRTPRLVDYTGVLERALLDVVAWAERGVAPAETPRYRVEHGQVAVEPVTGARTGVQAAVDLTAGGHDVLEVAVGQTVRFEVTMEIPLGVESVGVAWDVDGTGDFVQVEHDGTGAVVLNDRYESPGTYFPAVRVSVPRSGDGDSPFARVESLGRMRVIVR